MKTIVFCAAMLAASAAAATADTVRAVTAATLSPFSRGADQAMPGFNHELIQIVAERAGMDVEIIYQPWKRAQKTVAEGEDYVTFFTRNAAREDKYSWIAPMITVERVFATLDKPVNSLDEAASRDRIGAAIVYYRQLDGLGWTNIEESDIFSNLKKLKAGRVDTVYSVAQRLAFEWRTMGEDPSKLIIGEGIQTSDIWLGASPNYPADKAAKLKAALEEVRTDGTYAELYRKYFGNMPVLESTS